MTKDEFSEYVENVDEDKKELAQAWSIATGVQQVDGLTPSEYLYDLAKRNIEGEITFEEVEKLLEKYHKNTRKIT